MDVPRKVGDGVVFADKVDAPEAGVFVAGVEGLEGLGFATPADALSETRRSVDAGPVGSVPLADQLQGKSSMPKLYH